MEPVKFNSAVYDQALKDKKILGSRCEKCGAVFLPPRDICAECHSETMAAVEFSGEGTLAAYSVIYVPPTHMIESGFGRENPNCAGIVKLKEGPMISAQILDVDIAHPEKIKIGTPLKAEFLERGGKTYLVFGA